MANIVVTSTTNSIQVDFGDYAGGDIPIKRSYSKFKTIYFVTQESDRVTVLSEGSLLWNLSVVETSGCFIVDSINGNEPTDITDLYNKIAALIA